MTGPRGEGRRTRTSSRSYLGESHDERHRVRSPRSPRRPSAYARAGHRRRPRRRRSAVHRRHGAGRRCRCGRSRSPVRRSPSCSSARPSAPAAACSRCSSTPSPASPARRSSPSMHGRPARPSPCPSFGYVIGFIPAAGVVGWLAQPQLGPPRRPRRGRVLLASAIPFVTGLPYLAVVARRSSALPNDLQSVLAAGLYPFIVGGIAKALIAARHPAARVEGRRPPLTRARRPPHRRRTASPPERPAGRAGVAVRRRVASPRPRCRCAPAVRDRLRTRARARRAPRAACAQTDGRPGASWHRASRPWCGRD